MQSRDQLREDVDHLVLWLCVLRIHVVVDVQLLRCVLAGVLVRDQEELQLPQLVKAPLSVKASFQIHSAVLTLLCAQYRVVQMGCRLLARQRE